MNKIKVIFICVHNSARSQMAEAFLKKHGAGKFEVTSAGLEPGILNPVVVEVMKETGKDMHAKYRETSLGGLATVKRTKEPPKE